MLTLPIHPAFIAAEVAAQDFIVEGLPLLIILAAGVAIMMLGIRFLKILLLVV